MRGNNNKYQLVLVLNPKVEDKENILKKVTSWLESQQVKFNQTHIGYKDLVYEVNKNTKGDFWSLDLSSELSIKMKELNLLLNRESNIIRYLILKKE